MNMKIINFFIIIMITATLPTLAVADWPMLGHDPQHTGYSNSEGPDTNNELWSIYIGTDDSSSPAVYNSKIYIGSVGMFDYYFYCLDADNGKVIWEYTCQGRPYSPAVNNDKVYFGTVFGFLYCLDANDGEEIWVNYIGENYDSWWRNHPTIYDNKLYICSQYGDVHCYDADTGEDIWIYSIDGSIYSCPAVHDGKLYVGSYDDNMYCLDAYNGDKIWNYNTESWIVSSPAIWDGKVYFGVKDGNVYCLDTDSGEKNWNFTTQNNVVSSPAINDGKLYVGSYDDNMYCLDAYNGDKIWNYTTGGYVSSSPALTDNNVYFGSFDNNMYCLNADSGEKIWSYSTFSAIDLSPAIYDDKVYIGDNVGYLYCFGDNQAPKTPIIDGPRVGKIRERCQYNITIEDPTYDFLYIWIDWGDKADNEWLGPYEVLANEPSKISVNHTWTKQGSYTLKVKVVDNKGLESEWEIIEVSMPKNRATNKSLLHFLDNFLIIYQLIKRFLKL